MSVIPTVGNVPSLASICMIAMFTIAAIRAHGEHLFGDPHRSGTSSPAAVTHMTVLLAL